MPDWWRPTAMEADVSGNSAQADYLVLYRKIKDQDSWPQFFVLYEDGNIRLKPHAPKGMPDVCFGSSVIVGPATTGKRPHADIKKVVVNTSSNPQDFPSLDITYASGEIAHLDLFVDRTQAVVDVTPGYHTDAQAPFAVFRSMWVRDGRADADHIRTSQTDASILSDWTSLAGPWWFFYRATKSDHNPSAPDIWIGQVPTEHSALLNATFAGFERMVDKKTGLPYDRVDASSLQPAAYSVSVTEIGLRILELISARDLGLMPVPQVDTAMQQVLTTLEGLDRPRVSKELSSGQTIMARFFHGFYRFQDGHFVGDPGISFLDNGNLAVALAIATQAFPGTNIPKRAQAILDDMDFRFFLNPDGKTFSLGYDPTTNHWYTTFLQWGSEGVLSVFLAVCKDNVNPEALNLLLKASPARAFTTSTGEVMKTIPGYAGGLWVKLFPLLFLGTNSNNVHPAMLEDARRYVLCQIETARKQKLPVWGWSPASVLTPTSKKDYQEFGVPACTQYGTPSLDLVSPYSTFLTIGALSGYAPASAEISAAFANLDAIKQLNPNAYNARRGFVDVIDPRTGQVGKHLLSLDKGMEIVSLYNFLMRQQGYPGIDGYFWAYLHAIGKAEQARQIMQTLGKKMAEMIGYQQ